ncbi:MAG: hypothetical protein J6I56_05275 [Lachnospiraceae bacterium]|nr:hypothetical protein [Lachnospiraceae bacterium]
MDVFHLGDAAKYEMYFGFHKDGYQWSVKEAFMDIATSPAVLSAFSAG